MLCGSQREPRQEMRLACRPSSHATRFLVSLSTPVYNQDHHPGNSSLVPCLVCLLVSHKDPPGENASAGMLFMIRESLRFRLSLDTRYPSMAARLLLVAYTQGSSAAAFLPAIRPKARQSIPKLLPLLYEKLKIEPSSPAAYRRGKGVPSGRMT